MLDRLKGTGVGLNARAEGCRPCLWGAVAGVSAAAAANAAGVAAAVVLVVAGSVAVLV